MERNSHQGRLSKKSDQEKNQQGKKTHIRANDKKSEQEKKVKKNSHQGLPLSLVEELLESLLELIAVGRR